MRTFCFMKMPPEDLLRQDVDQILSSSERAARLVQSLLAFSRKQLIKPQVIDINEVIQNVGKLLRRLIGSDIELRTRLAKGTVFVMADAGPAGAGPDEPGDERARCHA